MKRKNKIYLIVVISFIILSILSDLLFMMHHILFDAWDMQFHLKRIIELIDSFNNFKFSPFSFNQFNGSAVMGLYPYINLFPIVLLSHFIQSKITLIYIFFALNTFFSLMICFFSSLSVSKNKWTSYLFAVIYSLSTVLLGYNYFFMDLGMSTVVTFLPLVIFGFVNLLKDNHYIELIIGMCLITFSHVLSVFIVSLFLLILLLIEFKHWTKGLWDNVVKVFIITAFITSIVWLPIVYLLFTNNINSPTLLKLQGLPNKIVLISLFGGTNPMGLGTFVIISAILSLFYWNHFNKFTKKLYLISIITIIICSKVFPWEFIPNFIALPLAHFQFTYRFLIVPILLLDYIFALIVTQYINKKKWRNSVICVSLIAAVGLRVFMQHHFISKNISQPTFSLVSSKYNKENTINYKMSNNKQVNALINFRPNGMNKNGYATDYYPKAAVSKVHYINNNEATYDRNRTINVEHTGYNQFSFDSPKKINRLALPLLHYNGEHLRVYVNHHLVHSHANGNSLVTLDNVKKGRSVVGVRSVPNVWLVAFKLALFLIGYMIISIFFIKHIFNKSYIKSLMTNLLRTKYSCELISLFITSILLFPSILNIFANNRYIDIIDAVVIGIPYFMIFETFFYLINFIRVMYISDNPRYNKFMRYSLYLIIGLNHIYKGRHMLLISNFLVFIFSGLYEFCVLGALKMSNIIIYLNRINKYVNTNYLSKIDNSYAIYFMFWLLTGILLFIGLAIINSDKIHWNFIKIILEPVVKYVSIIGVMITALSTIQRGDFTQSISYNFSIMFVYLMTPLCIISISIINIIKMKQQYIQNYEHRRIISLIKKKRSINYELYNSQYHYTK